MTSQSLQNFLDTFCVDEGGKVYTIDNFTIVNDGALYDGSTGADTYTGTSLSDIIWGNGGDDVLKGGGARDLLTGGAGNDDLYGGDGSDRLQGWGGDEELFGGKGDDRLYGGANNDTLFGGAGNDFLCGGSGDDELVGGGGADIFVFRPDLDDPKTEAVYLDFQIGIDRVRIEDYLLPDGLAKSMIKVAGDGHLYIVTEGGHRLTFETLDKGDKAALYDSISLI